MGALADTDRRKRLSVTNWTQRLNIENMADAGSWTPNKRICGHCMEYNNNMMH